MKCSEILFDSDVDDWSEDTSVFNERIIGKKQLTFLIEDEDGEIFGYYLNTEVVEDYGWKQETDSKSFHFNLRCNFNRLESPMKFEAKNLENYRMAGFKMNTAEDDKNLIGMGDVYIFKEQLKHFEVNTYVYQYDNASDKKQGIQEKGCILYRCLSWPR